MIVAMQEGADEALIQQVIEHLVKLGFEVHRSTGARMTVLGAVGSGIDFDIRNLELLPGVQEVHRISSPYKLAGKSFRPEGTIVKLANGIGIGGNEVVVMAGPWERGLISTSAIWNCCPECRKSIASVPDCGCRNQS